MTISGSKLAYGAMNYCLKKGTIRNKGPLLIHLVVEMTSEANEMRYKKMLVLFKWLVRIILVFMSEASVKRLYGFYLYVYFCVLN